MMTSPYHISWYLTDRVLLISINKRLENDEILEMQKKAFKLIKQAPHKVHAIIDLIDSESVGHTKEALMQVQPVRHRNQGTSVIILPMNPVRRFLSETVMNALGLQVKLCETFGEAQEKIAQLERKRKRESRRPIKE